MSRFITGSYIALRTPIYVISSLTLVFFPFENTIMSHLKKSTQYITKTHLYNTDPLKPHFYIVKLGFRGVYIIFLISAQNIDCGYSLEPPR